MLGLCEPSTAHHGNLVVFTPDPKEKWLLNEKKVSWLLPVAAPKPLVICTLIEKKEAPSPHPPNSSIAPKSPARKPQEEKGSCQCLPVPKQDT